mgnify:CR=1 FL=1
MSTVCHRCIERQEDDGSWKKCGEFSDNYHGFDRWRNEDYYERGFPEDSDLAKRDLVSSDGRDYTWGHSYINLNELLVWADSVKERSMSMFYSTLHAGITHRIERRLVDIQDQLGIDTNLHGDAGKAKSEDEYYSEYDPMGNFEQFKELYEECMEEYEGLNDQFIKAYTIASQSCDDRWIPPQKIRIVYYFS